LLNASTQKSVDGKPIGFTANEFYKDTGYQIGVPWLFYQQQSGDRKPAKQVLEPEDSTFRPQVKFHASFKQ
jgi:hypothetical protein